MLSCAPEPTAWSFVDNQRLQLPVRRVSLTRRRNPQAGFLLSHLVFASSTMAP